MIKCSVNRTSSLSDFNLLELSGPVTSLSDVASTDIESSDTATESAER